MGDDPPHGPGPGGGGGVNIGWSGVLQGVSPGVVFTEGNTGGGVGGGGGVCPEEAECGRLVH